MEQRSNELVDRIHETGRVSSRGAVLKARHATGQRGVGHTRWATHGPPSAETSHPHLDPSGRIAVVHNGVIENFERIKERLVLAGHKFHSETDTEVLAHLIGEHY